jgi:hypothetical protein
MTAAKSGLRDDVDVGALVTKAEIQAGKLDDMRGQLDRLSAQVTSLEKHLMTPDAFSDLFDKHVKSSNHLTEVFDRIVKSADERAFFVGVKRLGYSVQALVTGTAAVIVYECARWAWRFLRGH